MRIKDFILCFITALAWIFMFASFMAIAEGSLMALITLVLSSGWLWLFCKVNKEIL